jgi:thiol-disulfide isomerase/thioredoxin
MPSLLLAPLIAAAVLVAAWLILALQRHRQRGLVGVVVRFASDGQPDDDTPDILYFTGPNCTVCHVAQRPALRRLGELIADVRIREIDVAVDPASARTYRVMTLPTTVVLGPDGRTVAVNAGFASEASLRHQVEAARSSPLAIAPA